MTALSGGFAREHARKLAEAVVNFSKRLRVLEERLGKMKAYLAGVRFTMADVPVGCVINRYVVARKFMKERHPEVSLEGGVETPEVDAWHGRLLEGREAFKVAVWQSELFMSGFWMWRMRELSYPSGIRSILPHKWFFKNSALYLLFLERSKGKLRPL